MTRMAGQALSGGLVGDYLANTQGGAFEMGNNMGSERAQLASITMDPVGGRRNYIDDGDPSVYILNERGTAKRRSMTAEQGESIGLPREYMANPIQYSREVLGQSDFPNADSRRMPNEIRGRELMKLQGARLQGAPHKPADLEDLRD